MPLRFDLDEQIDPAVATGLRRRGIDATTTLDAGLSGASDERQISYAVTERRVLLTHDQDFLRLAALGTSHAGIVYNKQGTKAIGEIIEHLVLMDFCLSEEEMRNHIEFC